MLLAFYRKPKQFLKIPERADFLPYQLGCCGAIDRHKHFFTHSVDLDENQDGLALEPLTKGQLYSEWIYVVIVSPKMQTKNYKDFCPTKHRRIVAEIYL